MSQAVIGNLRVNLGLDSAQFEAGARRAQSTLGGLSGSLRGFGAAAAGVLGGLGLTALGTSIVTAVQQVAQIGDLAETIGITAEQVQVFNRMALASGASTEAMARGLQEIAEQSTDANSKLSQLFAANGISAQGRETNAVIRDFMTLLQNARTPAEQLAIATSVLGTRVGRELVEAFRTGADGVDQATQDMVKSGEYHSNAEVARLQKLEEDYNRVAASIATRWQQMVVALAQGVESLTTDSNVKWRGGNQAEFLQRRTQPRVSGMGAAGGPNEFNAPPVTIKTVILPPDATEEEKLKQRIKELEKRLSDQLSYSPVKTEEILPITGYDMRGTGLELRNLTDEISEANLATDRLTNSLSDGLAFTLTDIAFNARSAGDAMDMLRQSAMSALQGLTQTLLRSGLNMLLGRIGTRFGGAQGLMGFGGFYADGGTLGAGKWGIAGERGPEIIHGPARITPMDEMRGGGGVRVNNTVINNGSAQVSTRASRGADGTVNIETLIEDKVINTLGGGRAAKVMAGRYGAPVRPARA